MRRNHLELDAVFRTGREARLAGADFFHGNPHVTAKVPIKEVQQFEDWQALCRAWSAGWLKGDAGRTESVQRLLQLRFW